MNETAMEELQLLTKCKINEVPKMLHFIVDKMCGRKSIVSYLEFQHIWTLQEWWTICEKCSKALKDAVSNKWTKDDMEKIFQNLPTDYQLAVHDCVISRHEEIVRVLLNALADFDWQLKLTVGSDKMANINKPIASIQLNTTSAENVVLEMNKEELAKFIATLEQANRAISQLQT